MTPEQIKRIKDTWERLAEEPLVIEEGCETLYAYGSELAVRRLLCKMHVGRVKFTLVRDSWYYSKEMHEIAEDLAHDHLTIAIDAAEFYLERMLSTGIGEDDPIMHETLNLLANAKRALEWRGKEW